MHWKKRVGVLQRGQGKLILRSNVSADVWERNGCYGDRAVERRLMGKTRVRKCLFQSRKQEKAGWGQEGKRRLGCPWQVSGEQGPVGPLGFGNGKPFVGGDKVGSGEPVTRSLFEGIIFNSGKLHLLLERLREKDPWKGTFHEVPFYFLLDIALITRYYQHSLLNLTAKLPHLVLGEMDRKSASVTTTWSLMCFLPTLQWQRPITTVSLSSGSTRGQSFSYVTEVYKEATVKNSHNVVPIEIKHPMLLSSLLCKHWINNLMAWNSQGLTARDTVSSRVFLGDRSFVTWQITRTSPRSLREDASRVPQQPLTFLIHNLSS